MRPIVSLVFLICCLAFAASAFADETQQPEQQASDKNANKWIASSEVELARLAFEAIDNKNYEGLQRLLIPVELHRELVKSEEARANHAAYHKHLPTQAKRYRAFLDLQKILPLTGSKLAEIHTDEKASMLAGRKIRHNRGIRILRKFPDSDEEHALEIIDWAIAVDDRWFIRKLVIEVIEENMEKVLNGNGADTTDRDAASSR